MSLGQFARRRQWYSNKMTPAAVHEDLQNLRQELQRGFPGTNINDSALVGYVGEYFESVVLAASAVSSTGTGQYFDITSLALTAGDWDISAGITLTLNGATITFNAGGIGTASGNSSTGLVIGNNYFHSHLATSAYDGMVTVPSWRVSIAASTTYYLKANFAYSAGTPKASGRISARRIR